MYVSASPRTRTLTLRVGTEDAKPLTPMTLIFFVTPVGFEPTVFRLKVGGLNQLSYEVILGVRPVTIRLSPLSQSGGSTISPSYTIYFCGADGLRSRSSGFSDQRNDHICHSSLSFVERVGIEPTPLNFQSNAITWSATVPNICIIKKPKSFELGSVSFIIFILIKSLNPQKINTILFQYQVLIYC